MESKNNELLIAEIRNLSTLISKLYNRQSPWNYFLNGLLNSFGYFVGIAIIVAAVAYFLQQVPLIPMIGDWLGEVLKQSLKNLTPQQYLQLMTK